MRDYNVPSPDQAALVQAVKQCGWSCVVLPSNVLQERQYGVTAGVKEICPCLRIAPRF